MIVFFELYKVVNVESINGKVAMSVMLSNHRLCSKDVFLSAHWKPLFFLKIHQAHRKNSPGISQI